MAGEIQALYSGSPIVVITTTGVLADTNFSTSGAATLLEFDNSVLKYPHAVATLTVPGWGAAPDDNSAFDLFLYQQDVDGTNDEVAPTLSSSEGARNVGSFVFSDGAGAQYRRVDIDIWGIKKCYFAIRNSTGQSANSGVKLVVEAFTPQSAA